MLEIYKRKSNLFTYITEHHTFFSTLIHEMWHMFIAHNEDADVPQIGIKFMFITIFAYVKIIGVKSLKQTSRIKIYAAGIAANLFWGSCFLLIARLFNSNIYIFVSIFILGISNILQAFPNMLFILKLDGNYILEELFEIDDIYRSSFNFMINKKHQDCDILTQATYIAFFFTTILIIFSILFTLIFICNIY